MADTIASALAFQHIRIEQPLQDPALRAFWAAHGHGCDAWYSAIQDRQLIGVQVRSPDTSELYFRGIGPTFGEAVNAAYLIFCKIKLKGFHHGLDL